MSKWESGESIAETRGKRKLKEGGKMHLGKNWFLLKQPLVRKLHRGGKDQMRSPPHQQQKPSKNLAVYKLLGWKICYSLNYFLQVNFNAVPMKLQYFD